MYVCISICPSIDPSFSFDHNAMCVYMRVYVLHVLYEQAIIPSVNFPFLVMHDPNDVTTSINGSRHLLAKSQTPAELKLLVSLEGVGGLAGIHEIN